MRPAGARHDVADLSDSLATKRGHTAGRTSLADRLAHHATGGRMPRMLSLWTDRLARVGSGLGLLLLLAAQENVCPWLIPQPIQTPTPVPAREQSTDHPKRHKPILPLVLRDAPPRPKPVGWAHATLRHTYGDRDGVVSCGPRDAESPNAGPPVAWSNPLAWHALQLPAEPVTVRLSPDDQRAMPAPALHTCITPTGPPRA